MKGNLAIVGGGGGTYFFDVSTGAQILKFVDTKGDIAISGNRALIGANVYDITPVPEPNTLLLAAFALAPAALRRNKSNRRTPR